MDKNQTYSVSEGYSLDLLIPSVILFVISILFFLVNVWFGAFFSLVALLMLLFKTGIQLDVKEKKIRVYREIFSLKFGEWVSLEKAKECSIDYNRSAAILSSRGSSNLVRSETFSLYIKYCKRPRKLIHEFTNHELAKQTATLLKSEFNLAVVDQFIEIQRSIVSRRRSIRR